MEASLSEIRGNQTAYLHFRDNFHCNRLTFKLSFLNLSSASMSKMASTDLISKLILKTDILTIAKGFLKRLINDHILAFSRGSFRYHSRFFGCFFSFRCAMAFEDGGLDVLCRGGGRKRPFRGAGTSSVSICWRW